MVRVRASRIPRLRMLALSAELENSAVSVFTYMLRVMLSLGPSSQGLLCEASFDHTRHQEVLSNDFLLPVSDAICVPPHK